MTQKIYFSLLLLTISVCGFSQTQPLKSNSVYLEIAGVGGGHSLNYERRFFIKDSIIRIAARAGLNLYNITDFDNKFNPNIVVPVMPILLIGNKHNAEIGIGQSFASIIKTESGVKYRDFDLYTIFNFGYRYEKNLFVYRVGYTPVLSYQGDFKHWVGISFGVNF